MKDHHTGMIIHVLKSSEIFGFSFWPDLSTKLMIHLRVLLDTEEFLYASFREENNNSSLSSLKWQFAILDCNSPKTQYFSFPLFKSHMTGHEVKKKCL